jgi:O-glycosyl hydrolase
VVSSDAAQAITGFGASGAWWPNDLQRFPAPVRARVGELLFGPEGIALSMYRYNIGAGGKVQDPARAAQSFLVRAGVYDWTRDRPGMTFLRAAAGYGVQTLVGFANSAPAPWTTNHRACGGRLASGKEDDYADYLAAVTAHLHDADGITLSYVSPMNEPDSSFAECTQEGMAVPSKQRAALVASVQRALAARAPFAHAVADESSHLGQFVPESQEWLDDTGASGLGALVHHGYDYPGPKALRRSRTIAERFGNPLWLSEICCYNGSGFGAGYDPTMRSGMWLAHTVWDYMTQAQVSAFSWWTALSPMMGCDPGRDPACANAPNSSGWDDGLLYYDPGYAHDGNHRIYPSKRFWVLGNFSRFIRPGAVRHEVTGLPVGIRALAFRSGSDSGWTLVLLNETQPGAASRPVRIAFPSDQIRSGTTAIAYRTSQQKSLEPVGVPRVDPRTGTISATLPAQTVTTVVLTTP